MIEKFLKKVKKTKTCWLWIPAHVRNGYGSIRVGKKVINAHKYFYETLVGKVPKGKELDHLCRIPACVNPKHLEPVSHRENVLRGKVGFCNANKTHCPEGHPYSKENTYIQVKKTTKIRQCMTCRRLYYKKNIKSKINYEIK